MAEFFRTKDGKVILGQSPNPPIIGAGLAWCLAWLIDDGSWHALFRGAFWLLLSYWAVAEIITGVNGWRKTLGLAVLVYIIFNIL